MTVEIDRRAVEVEGRRGTYAVVGSGPPIVVVHGLSGSARWWRPLLPALAGHYSVYAINLPGYGAFTRHRSRMALTGMAAWLHRWIEAVGLRRAHVIGHSMGGYIAVHLAASAPELVDHLVLMDTAGVPTVRGLIGHAVPLLREARGMKYTLLPILTGDVLRAGPISVLRTANELLGQDIRPYLRCLRVPTLLVWGERDALVPLPVGEFLHKEIPGSQLAVIPKAGHMPMYDDPDAVAETILRFLEPKGSGA